MLHVTVVEVLRGYWLRLTLSDGDVVERVDIAPEMLIWNSPEPNDPSARPERRLRVRSATNERVA